MFCRALLRHAWVVHLHWRPCAPAACGPSLPIVPILLALLTVASPAFVHAQTGMAFGGPLDSIFTYTKQVDEVNMLFTVTDHKGRLISDLTSADFELLDNHTAPEKIRYFQKQTGLPLKVGILIDVSASISHRLSFEKKGARAFLKKVLRPGIDEGFVVTFDDQPHLLHDFSNDVVSLAKSFERVKAGGNTRLFDAVVFAANKLRRVREQSVTRRIIILITDGADNRSQALLNDAEQASIAADTVVFALSTNDLHYDYPQGEAILKLLTQTTGGSILPAREEYELNRAFANIEKTLRSQYAMGYTPAAFMADGSFHAVQIVPRKPGLTVRCRRGYYAVKQHQ